MRSLGADGKYPGNMRRDYMRLQTRLRRQRRVDLDIYMPSVRLTCHPRSPEISPAPVGMRLPHEMFATIWTHGTPKMLSELLGSDATAAEYWKHCDGSEWMKRHPVSKSRDQWNTCMPIGLHGDDVQTVRTSSKY